MAQTQQYLLYEVASGYALFLKKEAPELEQLQPESQLGFQDFGRFRKMVSFISFGPFSSADMAIENVDAISNGVVSPFLRDFLTLHLSNAKKNAQIELGVADATLGKNIQDTMEIKCVISDTILEIMRWIRCHIASFLPNQKDTDIIQAQLGLAHGFSRICVKMNVHRSDNMIIQAISLLDQMDKDINTFAMRVKEWYGWHFPELKKIVPDNSQYCRLMILIKDKSAISDALKPEIVNIVGEDNSAVADEIISIAHISMGMDFVEQDFQNIECFARRVVNLSDYRRQLFGYLCSKMNMVAPNLAALMGEQIGGRLICQAGSLTNLAKFPASTVQILGAEKALFRALKTKTNTPKYGLIFHSTYIGRAAKEHKGRISRYLANKASLCSRLDCFMEQPNRVFGEIFSKQVENRLKHLQSGEKMPTNEDTMTSALKAYKKSLKKKRKGGEEGEEATAAAEEGAAVASTTDNAQRRKEEKKKRKAEKLAAAAQFAAEAVAAATENAEEPTKKKKKKQIAVGITA